MNPLFKQHVDQLFDKLAGLHQPSQVATDLRAAGHATLPGQIERGQAIIDTAKSLGRGARDFATSGSSGLSRVFAPMHTEGKALFRELGDVGSHLTTSARLPVVAGGLMMLPILGDAFHGNQQRREDELMNLQMNPMQKTSHLDLFLEKKAAASARVSLPSSIRGHMHDSFTSGVGQGIGGGIAKAILGTLSGGYHAIHDALIVDPKRKALFESVVRTDPVIHDAVTRTPNADKTLAEAFQTMVRFAPSLSLDVNAVRSFLREAVIGGAAGVNYATIKTLIETEKGLRPSGDHK